MSRRVLVTGGAGFLGSHLCERLLASGDEVICLDNFYTGSKKNIHRLLDHPCFKLVEHDIVEPFAIEAERIYNLACPASPVHYQNNPVKTVKANVMGTLNVLELAKRTGARVLQASTSEVYGDPLVHPQSEGYWGNVSFTGPRACYDEGKRVAETLCFDHHRERLVDIRIARIFNTYGPRMLADDGRVVSNFSVSALRDEPLVLYGDGSQTRSFCYVDDLVEGLTLLMESDAQAQPVNLGNPEETRIGDLAALVARLAGSGSTLVNKPPMQDDPKRRRPDITLARRLLGWQPQVPLEEGLRRTLAFFRDVAVSSLSR